MYESHFGLENRPFLAAPLAERYFAASSIEEARRNLVRAIQRSEGPGLIIGPAGIGKSQLCHVLAEQFRETFAVAVLDSARLCTRRALLQAIFHGLGLPFREREEGELRLSLIDLLNDLPEGKQGMLLIVDEAHSLPLRLLEEIRLITNLVNRGVATVRLVLAGSPSLEERFASPKLDSFNQRIAARCYLQPFDYLETQQYVRAQLAVCGDEEQTLVTDDGLQAIHHATGGIPRLINQVCDHALVLACAGGVGRVDAAVVEEAWGDLQQLPVPWTPDRDQDAEEFGLVEFGTLDDSSSEEDDDAIPAIRFPDKLADKASAKLDEIEQQLADLDEEFQPAGVIGPEVELNFQASTNPFDEAFDTEEVILDSYASLDDSILKNRPKVTNRGEDSLPELEKGPVADLEISLLVDEHSQDEAAPTDDLLANEPMDGFERVGEPGVAIDTGYELAAAAPLEQLFQFEAAADPIQIEIDELSTPDEAEQAAISLCESAAAHDPIMPEAWTPETARSESIAADAAPGKQSLWDTDGDAVILVEDDDEVIVAAQPKPRVERREYRQLFARLRQG
ncbi:MAG: AAA family ATPase [Planctomycetales bacterium]|nr:AAA family ATPase [Planctomycetales bacterium]